MTRKRFWLAFAASSVVLVAIGVVFRHDLIDRAIAFRMARATDGATRKALADDLVSRGPLAISGPLAAGPAEVRIALIDAIGRLPTSGPNFGPCAVVVFDSVHAFDDNELTAALALMPHVATIPELREKATVVVSAALNGGPNAKAAACRFALRFDLASAVVPLLSDADASVRTAAVLAVGPAGAGEGENAVSDEWLFRLLSDSDADVRSVTAAALGTRGLDDRQIALARKLAHADPAERLSLLIDLRWAGDAVKDPGPWLARLAKDGDPAVRAGAARAAVECGCSSADWVNDLAERDPDPLVRMVANHFRPRANPTGIVPVGVR